jgi:hypothetical protein
MSKKRPEKVKFDTSFNFGANAAARKPRSSKPRKPRSGKSKSNAWFKGMHGS